MVTSELCSHLKHYCKDCIGESSDTGICENIVVHGECPLWIYNNKEFRAVKKPDGSLETLYRTRSIVARIKRHCKNVCNNGNKLEVCSSSECDLYPIAIGKMTNG